MNDYLQNEDSESSPLVIPSLQPKDFPPLVTEYEIGDCVKIQNGEFSTSFGIISRIGTEADPNFYSKFWFKSFITVEEAYGKPPLKHHSDNEIVKYFDIEKEDLKAITCRVEIMFYYDYIEKYHKDAVKNGLKRIEVPSNVYFYRQHKVIPSGELYPALEPNCVCRKILNINDTLFECPSQCGKLYHVACFLSSSVRSCSKCGCNIEHSTIGLNTPNIGRKRDDKADAKLADPMCEQSFMQALSQQSDSDHLDSTKSSQNSQEQSKRRPKSLVDFIENKRREIRLEDKQSKLHPDALKRKKVREKLLFLFLDAIEECKANGDPFTSLEDIQISEHSSYQKSYELACQFANLIETEVWVSTAKQITENYSKKVISIYSSLKNPVNKLLVEQILRRKVDVCSLVKRPVDDLVSEETKHKRQLIEQNIIKESLLINEPLIVVSKSHKGEEVIELSNDAAVYDPTGLANKDPKQMLLSLALVQSEFSCEQQCDNTEESQLNTKAEFAIYSKARLIESIKEIVSDPVTQNTLSDIVLSIDLEDVLEQAS